MRSYRRTAKADRSRSRLVRDEFSPLAFLYDLRVHGGLAHHPNMTEAAAAAVRLGLPVKTWYRADYLRLLNLIADGIRRISGHLWNGAQTMSECNRQTSLTTKLEALGKVGVELGMFINRSDNKHSFEKRFSQLPPEERRAVADDLMERAREVLERRRTIEARAQVVEHPASDGAASNPKPL